jgi:hypothetical protein
MQKNFTTDDLIRYAYNETMITDTVLIQQAIDDHIELEETYIGIVSTMRTLDGLMVNPSEKSILTILNYSKSLA